jgi:hypothetical protein
MITSIPSRLTHIQFNLPDENQAITSYFEGKGYILRQSVDSKYSDSVAQMLGGIQNIGILARKDSLVLLDILALKSTKKIAQRIVQSLKLKNSRINEIEQILDEYEVIPELKGIPKSYKMLFSHERLRNYKPNILNLLSTMCEMNLLRRGFYLDCPKCGAPDWYPLNNLHEKLICTGCSFVFILPVKYGDAEIQWQYRLNTLINRAVDQDVLVGIISLYYTTRNISFSSTMFAMEILWHDKLNEVITDFDFIFISHQKLFGGECKSGVELNEKDIKSASLAAKLGFHKFFFCTVKDFSQESKDMILQFIEELKSNGYEMKVEILSGKELIGDEM